MKLPSIATTVLAVVLGGFLTWGAIEAVSAHANDEARHLSPEIHQQLGRMEGQLGIILDRLPEPE